MIHAAPQIVYAVFFNPQAFPGMFVLQQYTYYGQLVFPGPPLVLENYDDLRAQIPKNVINAGRDLTHPPCLLENWVHKE